MVDNTPLMRAVTEESTPEIVKLLIEAGADVNAKSDNGWLILGNTRTGDWRKLQAMAPPLQIADMAREMLGESVPVPTPETATREK